MYDYLLIKIKPQILITTHLCYVEYGIIARVAQFHSAVVIETTDMLTSTFPRSTRLTLNYHNGIQLQLSRATGLSLGEREEFVFLAKKKLQDRFTGKLQHVDAIRAYPRVHKNSEDINSIIDKYPEKIIVVLFSHVFNDSPHTSSSMIYQDYFVWLRETTLICESSRKIHLVIKPHPGSSKHEIEQIKNFVVECQLTNVSVLPMGCNTYEILKVADIILTVQGTIGLEAAALGKIVLTAGNAFYAHRGFTFDSSNKSDYTEKLRNLHLLKPLSKVQIQEALITFGLWNELFDWENPLVSPECIALVWRGDPVGACRELLKNLSASLIDESKLFNNRQLDSTLV